MNSLEDFERITLAEHGRGRPILVLHGGGGPLSVAPFVEAMAASGQVLAPTHPGFNGTPPLEGVETVAELAGLYARLLHRRGVDGALVVGFSMGGWIAAELALQAPGAVGALVLVNAVGIEVEGEAVADVFSLAPRELAALSFHDPARYFVDPAGLPPERLAVVRANFAALKGYGVLGRDAESRRPGVAADPGLRARLRRLQVPTLVAWGESDRVATPAYGRAWADAIPGARFECIAECGHLPQIEQPARLLELVRGFAA